jgi:hypothetical protein
MPAKPQNPKPAPLTTLVSFNAASIERMVREECRRRGMVVAAAGDSVVAVNKHGSFTLATAFEKFLVRIEVVPAKPRRGGAR